MKKKNSIRGRVNGAPNPIDVHVGRRVRTCRTMLGVTQEKMAADLGVTFQQVQKYERGANRIGASRLWDISQVLKTPISFFYEGLTEAEDNLSPRHLEHIRDLENIDLSEPISNFDNSPLNKKETAELVRYYYRIQNRSTARQIFELIKSLAKESLDTLEEDDKETLDTLE